jgi:chemotaxis protein MotA
VDIASIIGLFLGITAVVGGALLEGLHLGSIAQPTAALIVLGGTIGATVLSFPLKTVKSALVRRVGLIWLCSAKPPRDRSPGEE